MAAISGDEFKSALEAITQGHSKTQAANLARMPYDLFVHMLKKHEKEQEREHDRRIQRDIFSKLTTGRGELTEAQRLKRLSRALITEMEERVATNKTRDEMSNSELVNMNKMIVQTITNLETGTAGDVSGIPFNVITNMPKKKYDQEVENDDDDEKIH